MGVDSPQRDREEEEGHSGWRPRRQVAAWALWDFATTPYSVVISTVVFPTFFKETIMGGDPAGDFLWGVTGSLATFLVILLAPAAGAYADAAAAKHRLLNAFTLLNIAAVFALALLGPGTVVAGVLLFVLASVGWQAGSVFYSAFLPEIAPFHRQGFASGLGDGLGYVGALMAMGVALLIYRVNPVGEGLGEVRPLFVFVGTFTLLAALPSFLVLRDKPCATAPTRVSIRGGFARELQTLRHVHRYPNTFRFLLAFLFYTDAVTTMTAFVSIYARSENLTLSQIMLIFFLGQLTAAPASVGLGRLADRIGAKATIYMLLVLWLAVLGYGLLANAFVDFLIVGLMAGAGVGALSAVSRTMMSQVSPPEKQAEFFGFQAVAGRASAVIGPPIVGAISWLAGGTRPALPVLMLLLVVAMFILRKVKVEAPAGPDPEPTSHCS
ncbi:MAG: MFS transporter [Gaiellales bacterium]|nr:MFS transporter [Gaiellales bacterium]